jgi:hypothetical protein
VPCATNAKVGQNYLSGSERLAGAFLDQGSLAESETRNADSLIQTKLDEILRRFDSGVGIGTQRRKVTSKPSPPTKRDTILFGAIASGLEGLKYCSFLDNHRVRPKWSDTGPRSYRDSYLASGSYKKKVQDEKSRAKQRKNHFEESVLAEAFITYLPDEFDNLGPLLNSNSRNSRDASKKIKPSTGA